jgi:hypothetical protein
VFWLLGQCEAGEGCRRSDHVLDDSEMRGRSGKEDMGKTLSDSAKLVETVSCRWLIRACPRRPSV